MWYPRGRIEDMLVRVGKLIFLVDLVILDIDEDMDVLLILARPFLVTSSALIDVQEGRLVLWARGEEITFKQPATKGHAMVHDDTYYSISTGDFFIDERMQETLVDALLEEYLGNLDR